MAGNRPSPLPLSLPGAPWGAENPLDLETVKDEAAREFLRQNPLDASGWIQLFNSRVDSYPAKPIIEAAELDSNLSGFVPLDLAGMLTDSNPGKLYLRV